MKYYYLI
jgi:H+-translocating diphosphatase